MVNNDLNSVYDTEVRLFKELEELKILENFKSLFATKKRLSTELDELNQKKKDILNDLKEILFDRDDKEKDLKQLDELIEKEKELFPKEYEEYRLFMSTGQGRGT